ncbi:probable disease resistance protein At4g27220 isoform X2 [Coffea arabica]|uniref:Probable disease resistance protein At4g27220 isoform X2 n=1 Tax=Coffea arabica TaxID=13443 RepID=A0ABM4UC13_COFAR
MEALGNLALDRGRRYVNLDDNLRSLERKLQRLGGRKSDFELQVTNAERSGTKKRKREVEIWFEEVATVENEFGALKKSIQEGGFLENAISSGDRVAKMDAIVEELIEQSKHFDGLLLEASESRGEPRVTTKLFGEIFDRGLKEIWAWLVIDSISNIGIYGMGGVGKTTLAKHIHNHLLERTQFKVYWITVSQEFSIKRLQDDIAKRLRLDLSYEDDEDSRAAILSRALVKQSVLILDDVWQEFSFEKIGIPLGANKCKVILTTRSLELCNRISCQRVFEAKTLAIDEAWDLFQHTLDTKTVLHGNAEDIAKSIVKRCAGLPLGIITVAGSMKGVTDICEWRNALEQLKACSVGYDAMEEKVFPILEWSFKRLNEYESHCFLYCSLYPEDSKLKIKALIDLFIWAELMQERNSWSQEFDQGHAILNKLIKVCLLEETRDYEGDDCVKMHDLVRDMALRITDGKSNLQMNGDVPRFLVKSIGKGNSKVTLEPKKWTEDLHAASFHSFSYGQTEIKVPPAWPPNCPKLSTLLLSQVFIREIPDSFFHHMCGLKVLNLSWCQGITELPNSVSNLVHLTALILRGCQGLRSVPPLGKLKQLRIVDLSSTQIQDLPQGLESLVDLERLNLEDCIRLRSVPPLGKLKQLRDLDLSRTKIEDLPQGWESLVNLERLNLSKCWAFRRKIIPKGTFSQFHCLQLLVLTPNGRVQVNDPEVLNQLESFEGCLSFMDFYKITRWPKYYHVYINDILTKNPSFIMYYGGQKVLYFHQCKLGKGSNYLPDDMKSLIIEDCEGMGIRCLSDVFKNFINLSHLSRLYIKDSVGIEFLRQLSSAFPHHQLEVSSFSSLRDLKELRLHRLPNLVGLFYGESEPYVLLPSTFSSLSQLRIYGCHNMKQIFTVQLLQSLQNLKELILEDCEGLKEIAADGNRAGQGRGEGFQLTSSGATATVIVLPKLKLLHLYRLPQLKNICKAAMICDSIKEIIIFHCPKVKRLPLFLATINGLPSLPSTLSKIRGDREWWESLEWDYPSAKNALDPFFTTLWWDDRRPPV